MFDADARMLSESELGVTAFLVLRIVHRLPGYVCTFNTLRGLTKARWQGFCVAPPWLTQAMGVVAVRTVRFGMAA
jgi:hypothetical protein